MLSQIICITWIEFKLRSLQRLISHFRNPKCPPSKPTKEGTPCQVTQWMWWRDVALVLFLVSRTLMNHVKALCHAPWGLSEFANLMISRFVVFFGGGEVDLQLLGRGYKDENWNGSFWKHRWISGFDPRMVAHAPWMLPWSTTNSTWIHGTWNGRRKPSPLTPSRTERPAGKRPCCWHDDFVLWLCDLSISLELWCFTIVLHCHYFVINSLGMRIWPKRSRLLAHVPPL